ncbi:MAG: type II toxin-antitoxin system RelE/ParE family toxin [Candidatus Hatepunaea meridiana]|nr:type II toxin-antitoxin system RelE/ParE family toxin [Candidatus Hatepunaea meridiana]
MPVYWTPRFSRDWKKLPTRVKEKARNATRRLEEDRTHPSLRLKRIKRLPGYWEIRVDDGYRIILTIEGDSFTFMTIGPHDILNFFQII